MDDFYEKSRILFVVLFFLPSCGVNQKDVSDEVFFEESQENIHGKCTISQIQKVWSCDGEKVYELPDGDWCYESTQELISESEKEAFVSCESSFLFGIGEPIEWNTYNNGRDLDPDLQMEHLLSLHPKIYRMWLWSEFLNEEYEQYPEKIQRVGDFHPIEYTQETIQKEIATYQKNIQTLQESGIIVIGMDHLFPRWITGFERDGIIPIPDTPEYVAFLDQYEIMWKHLAELFPMLHYWETGNEFNHNLFLKPEKEAFTRKEKARIQVDLMERSLRAIKSVTPDAFIFMPAPYPEDENYESMREFIAFIYEEIRKRETSPRQYFDGIAWHPYWYSGMCDPEVNCDMTKNEGNWVEENVRTYEIVKHYEENDISILFSEFGFQSGEKNAEYLQKSYELAEEHFPWLWGWTYFRMMDDASDPSGGENYGLLYAAESENSYERKDSADIFSSLQ